MSYDGGYVLHFDGRDLTGRADDRADGGVQIGCVTLLQRGDEIADGGVPLGDEPSLVEEGGGLQEGGDADRQQLGAPAYEALGGGWSTESS